jgi:hypothetical protein
MRKSIAEIDPDVPVVGVTNERVEIPGSPIANDAAAEAEVHAD